MSVVKILAKRIEASIESVFLVENFKSVKGIKNSQVLTAGVTELTTYLSEVVIGVFQQAMIHPTLAQQLFYTLFGFVKGSLLNGILLRQQFCSESFAAFLLPKVEALDQWAKRDPIWLGNAADQLLPVRQISQVLMLKDKTQIVDERIRKNMCPDLNPLQLRQLLAMYTPDEYGKRVPITVINSITIPQSKAEEMKILVDLGEIAPFPVNKLHYVDITDTYHFSIPFALKTAIERIFASPEDDDEDVKEETNNGSNGSVKKLRL